MSKQKIFLQQFIIEKLHPLPHGYKFLDFHMLPLLCIVGQRYLAGDVVNTEVIKHFRTDPEFPRQVYGRSPEGLNPDKKHKTLTLRKLFGYREEYSNGDAFNLEMDKFFEKERLSLKHDPSKSWGKRNIMTVARLSFLLCVGASITKFWKSDSEEYFRKFKAESITHLGTLCPLRLSRYIISGIASRYWHSEDSKVWEPHKELLCSVAGPYIYFLARKVGMKGRENNLCAMILSGMEEARKRERHLDSYPKRSAENLFLFYPNYA